MHNSGYKSALARRACQYSDAQPPRKTDGVLLESELPPRMRGKDAIHRHGPDARGITPAYAGKSGWPSFGPPPHQDYPRICEERKGVLDDFDGVAVRITPAYAGKSWRGCTAPCRCRDHPRICGEKRVAVVRPAAAPGLPPHMRGKKRRPRRFRWGSGKDHPRICGEKYRMKPNRISGKGSPPRMRGKVRPSGREIHGDGITPAYAGKSVALLLNFPEMRGSPPRMRGKGACNQAVCPDNGITPAYAGKSGLNRENLFDSWDHPRVCGEKPRVITLRSV